MNETYKPTKKYDDFISVKEKQKQHRLISADVIYERMVLNEESRSESV